jgi:nicotinate phosphoribosyltransferase
VSWKDGKRLDASLFEIDPRMRRGRYTDAYFQNVVAVLARLAEEEYRFAGACEELSGRGLEPGTVEVGNIEVEMQCFARREPSAVVCGADHAAAILKQCAGYVDVSGTFQNTFEKLDVEAVFDGATCKPWVPAVRIRGRYRDFALLETPVLGVLARGSRIATNTYEALRAAGGKGVLMFGARFDLPVTQSSDGYAYKIGVDRYNADTGSTVAAAITTEAQGQWWGAEGSGTTSHSFVLSFLRDATEAMLQFARCLPPEVKRIALVDTGNDCVADARRCALAFFDAYRRLVEEGRGEAARRYELFGVRCDTAGELRDAGVPPTGDDRQDKGVVPRLVRNVRDMLDSLHDSGQIAAAHREKARRYFRQVRIVASGGFDARRIAWFESEHAPVDFYGVGSHLMSGTPTDFTADVVRVKVGDRWADMAKVGRRAIENPELASVT